MALAFKGLPNYTFRATNSTRSHENAVSRTSRNALCDEGGTCAATCAALGVRVGRTGHRRQRGQRAVLSGGGGRGRETQREGVLGRARLRLRVRVRVDVNFDVVVVAVLRQTRAVPVREHRVAGGRLRSDGCCEERVGELAVGRRAGGGGGAGACAERRGRAERSAGVRRERVRQLHVRAGARALSRSVAVVARAAHTQRTTDTRRHTGTSGSATASWSSSFTSSAQLTVKLGIARRREWSGTGTGRLSTWHRAQGTEPHANIDSE